MLLRFSIKNYKSFREETVFSMMPAPKQTGLGYSILREKKYKGLCSAIIYGPNASGKTNIIGAMDTMRALILRGNIRNSEQISSNRAASFLELIPNCCAIDEPVIFGIAFTENGSMYEYYLSVLLGNFLQEKTARRVLLEKLSIDGKEIFVRTEKQLSIGEKNIKKYLIDGNGSKLFTLLSIAENSLDDEELFLCNGFKTVFSKKITSEILQWFQEKLTVVYRADRMRLVPNSASSSEDISYIEKTLSDAAKEIGIASNNFRYHKEGEETKLYSVFEGTDKKIQAEIFESFGTIRFINEFPLILRTLLTGGTLVVDEFDASIHPMIIFNIISMFHNDEINKNRAQLIFNTHNPIYLNGASFRRDEIKFVDRNEDNISEQYALSDFPTASGVRKGEVYMKNYFINRYGAIRVVDFGPIVRALSGEKNEKRE